MTIRLKSLTKPKGTKLIEHLVVSFDETFHTWKKNYIWKKMPSERWITSRKVFSSINSKRKYVSVESNRYWTKDYDYGQIYPHFDNIKL